MARIKTFDAFGDFVRFNQDFIDANPLLHYFLTKTIKKVYDGEITLYKFFNVLNEADGQLIVLFVRSICLVYGNYWDKEMVEKLSEHLEFHKFKQFVFAGNKNVINALFELNAVTYKLIKHLIVYRCEQVASCFNYSPGEMQMADLNRLRELTRHSVAFTKEYNGEEKSYEEMERIILNGIMDDNLYQWIYNGQICAIAQADHDKYDFPVIGHVYTIPIFRNKGYAASIVHRLTKGLLHAGNGFCMLYTDGGNPASNKAFIRVGYKSTGEYIQVYKNHLTHGSAI